MEEIMAKADELGRLIRNTEIYKNFQRLSGLLRADPDAANFFDEYLRLSGSIKERQDRGDTIESYEMEHLKNMRDLISANELILRYTEARQDYLDLLVEIRNQISDSDFV